MPIRALRTLSDADAPVAVTWSRSSRVGEEANIHSYRAIDGRLHQMANSREAKAVLNGRQFDSDRCFMMDDGIWVPSPGPTILVTRIEEEGAAKYSFVASTAPSGSEERFEATASMRVSMLDLARTAGGLQNILGTHPLQPLTIIGNLEMLQDGIDTAADVAWINSAVLLRQHVDMTDGQKLHEVGRELLQAVMLAQGILKDMEEGVPVGMQRLADALDAMRPVIDLRIAEVEANREQSRSRAAQTRELQRRRRLFNLLLHRDIVDFVHGEAQLDRSSAPELSELKL